MQWRGLRLRGDHIIRWLLDGLLDRLNRLDRVLVDQVLNGRRDGE